MMEDQVQNILEAVFECTLDMINKDFSEYPEHRVSFYRLLHSITENCFPALMGLDARQFKLITDSCLWAAKHDNRDVEYQGLIMLHELVNQMGEMSCKEFFETFFK